MMPGPVQVSRRLPYWIDAFIDWSADLGSPEIFRRWAAICAIGAALERRVWVRVGNKPPLYPTFYVILVGPPGVGKTNITATVGRLWEDMPDHHIAPSSVTKAALIDQLVDARRTYLPLGGELLEYNSLFVIANELGVLIPGYDSEFMSVLTDIYDGYPYGERRRSKDIKITIKAPQLQLLAATTPSFLATTLPEGAWDQGFMARAMMIYSGENTRQDPFLEQTSSERLQTDLVADLKSMGTLHGKATFDVEARDFITHWHVALNGEPAPDHPKLFHYISRRITHLIKLSLVASVAYGSSLRITIEHVKIALDWLTEAENSMPDIFKSMAGGGDSRAIEEAWYYCLQIHTKEKRPIAEPRLVGFVQERVPAHSVMRVIELMVRGHLLTESLDGNGQKAYVPQPRAPR